MKSESGPATGRDPVSPREAGAASAPDDRLSRLIHHVPAVMYACEIDDGFRPIYVSENFRTLFGHEPEDCLGNKTFWSSRLHPDEVDRIFAELNDSLFVNDGHVHEYRFRHGDGSYRWVRDEMTLIRDENGAPVEIVGVWTDITDRRLAEEAVQRFNERLEEQVQERTEALRESEERYRELAQLSPDGIMVFRDEKVVFANSSLARVFGADSPEQLIGRSPLEFAAPEERDGALRHRERASAGVESGPEEVRCLRLDGSETYLERCMSVVNWHGKPSYLAILRDVNARRRAQQALRDSERRFRSIFDNSPAAIFLKDRDGRFQLVNPRFREWHGLAPEAAIGRRPSDLFPDPVGDLHVRRDREVIESRSPCTYEVDVRFADGTGHALSVNKFPILGADGACTGIVGIVSDVTHLHKTEAQLRQAQKMEAVGQLTGGMAHDFNSLLAIIQGNAEILAEALEGHQSETGAILRASARGAELTQRLLAFSRRQPLHPQAIDLADLVAGLASLMKRTLGEIIEVKTVADAGLWLASADPGQVENALLNLAINARDAMPDGGKLEIGCRNERLDDAFVARNPEVVAGDYVVLIVGDTGTGMSPEVAEHAFEPFYTTKAAGRGSGLGLSMVYGFAKQSGGHVSLDSELGRGTTVRLYLPRTEDAATGEVAPAGDEVPRGAGETVLLIEDDEDVRALTVEMLERLGYRVIDVADAADGRTVLDGGEPVDLILSDVVLPGGLSGARFAQEVRARDPGLPIILVSGYAAEAAQADDFSASDWVLLNNPFKTGLLAKALRKALG